MTDEYTTKVEWAKDVENRLKGLERVLASQYSTLDIHQQENAAHIKELAQTVDEKLHPPTPDRAELYTSLVAAQLEIKNAEQNIQNEFLKSKYADLASVMDAVRGPLARNGLAIVQFTADVSQSELGIRTLLVHTSGQTLEDIITMSPPKLDPQGIGSCRTYMRRYAVLAMCGIAGAIDDDAEGAKADPEDYERITPEEIDTILATADDLFKDRADWVIQQMVEKTFDVSHVSQIKAGEAKLAITRLKNTARREKAKAKKGAGDKPSPTPPTTESKAEPGADG